MSESEGTTQIELTYREKKKALEETLEKCLQSYQIIQERPNTCVVATFVYRDEKLHSFGFTKVCRPDKWDSDYGIALALRKATSQLAKRLLGKKNRIVFCNVNA